MKVLLALLAVSLAVFTSVVQAYEYALQFIPNPGYQNLVVAGYAFQGPNVIGSCSYSIGTAATLEDFTQTCTWDSHGNLLSIRPGALAIPAPLYTSGTLTVYADNGHGSYTGVDSRLPEGGFVNTALRHYSWLTPETPVELQKIVYTFTISLQSDGELPVDITVIHPGAALGMVTLQRSNCIGSIQVGTSCSITVTYDPTHIVSTREEVRDSFRILLGSDAENVREFIQTLTIELSDD